MHLPVSSEGTLHFYRYLHTCILITDKQFLLLINIPMQDCAQQLEIYEIFKLVIPHENFSECYNINSKYLGITYDTIKAVEISEHQFCSCQKASRSYAVLMHPFNHLQIHHHVLQQYTQRTRPELKKDAHYKSGTQIL